MTALGVDISGTIIEVQIFGSEWTVLSRLRIQTLQEYAGFIHAIAEKFGSVHTAAHVVAKLELLKESFCQCVLSLFLGMGRRRSSARAGRRYIRFGRSGIHSVADAIFRKDGCLA